MTRRTLAVVSAGLGRPSSTRLLADRLAAAARDELARRGAEVELRTVELREHAHDVVNHLLAEQVDRRPPSAGPADPFALTTSFTDLLASS